jgi:hypothetical protein
MKILILEFFNLFCAGILAGIEIAVHYGIHKPTLALDEKPQIVLRQGLTHTLRWLVPGFFVPMTLSGIALTIIAWDIRDHYFQLAAIFSIIVWIIIRVIGTVPVNSAVIEWNPDSPPEDWKEQINKVEKFHIIGTWAAIVAFLFFMIALMQSLL